VGLLKACGAAVFTRAARWQEQPSRLEPGGRRGTNSHEDRINNKCNWLRCNAHTPPHTVSIRHTEGNGRYVKEVERTGGTTVRAATTIVSKCVQGGTYLSHSVLHRAATRQAPRIRHRKYGQYRYTNRRLTPYVTPATISYCIYGNRRSNVVVAQR